MIVVVATTDEDLALVQQRVLDLGGCAPQVTAPGDQRRLVLTTFIDEAAAERAAATLRAEGLAAVTRPLSGPRLEAWTRHSRPICLDGRLSVCFAWAEHDRRTLPGLVELGPGGFGNGEHPTTRLLIEELLRRITGGERVLDVGCGSGVLGLCALRLGASHVVAMDMKPDAVDATRRNAVLNGMDDRVQALLAPLPDGFEPFDVIVANIGRAGIVALAPELIRLLARGGWLAVSGISPSQCSLVAGFLAPLVALDERTSGEWASLVVGPA